MTVADGNRLAGGAITITNNTPLAAHGIAVTDSLPFARVPQITDDRVLHQGS